MPSRILHMLLRILPPFANRHTAPWSEVFAIDSWQSTTWTKPISSWADWKTWESSFYIEMFSRHTVLVLGWHESHLTSSLWTSRSLHIILKVASHSGDLLGPLIIWTFPLSLNHWSRENQDIPILTLDSFNLSGKFANFLLLNGPSNLRF